MAITTSVKDNDGQRLCALRWSSHRLSPSQMFSVLFSAFSGVSSNKRTKKSIHPLIKNSLQSSWEAAAACQEPMTPLAHPTQQQLLPWLSLGVFWEAPAIPEPAPWVSRLSQSKASKPLFLLTVSFHSIHQGKLGVWSRTSLWRARDYSAVCLNHPSEAWSYLSLNTENRSLGFDGDMFRLNTELAEG